MYNTIYNAIVIYKSHNKCCKGIKFNYAQMGGQKKNEENVRHTKFIITKVQLDMKTISPYQACVVNDKFN